MASRNKESNWLLIFGLVVFIVLAILAYFSMVQYQDLNQPSTGGGFFSEKQFDLQNLF